MGSENWRNHAWVEAKPTLVLLAKAIVNVVKPCSVFKVHRVIRVILIVICVYKFNNVELD
ncbi:hypothetical protein OK016_12900 [Vibrio chagasii]|nr:hypothetical protein [Vibrio chagasii]